MKNNCLGRFCLLLSFLLCLLLSGCGQESLREMTTEPTQTEPVLYTVQFFLRDTAVSIQQVEEGAYPATPQQEGWIIAGWLDGEGQPVEPEAIPVLTDAVYTALAYPDLSAHTPYLFTDEEGNIHPDDPLTGEALKAALEALAVRSETLDGLSFPESDAELTAEELREVLTGCFSWEMLDGALSGVEEGTVSRTQFARIMNGLLNRDGGENVRLAEQTVLPQDLALNREDCAGILEACLSHTPSEEGLPIGEAVLNMPWEPGFTNHCGWLYYADENGNLLRNGQVGTLTFGADGRYTSGDEELDAIVAELVDRLLKENPEAERLDVLRAAFIYCRDSFRYVNKMHLDYGATGWETEAAKLMHTEKAGNCYHYAASFWALARGLGYEARCVSGYVFPTANPHGWVVYEVDGKSYIADPQQGSVEVRGLEEFWGLDLFMIAEEDWWKMRYDGP